MEEPQFIIRYEELKQSAAVIGTSLQIEGI